MIQRIQSIYLFVAFIALSLMFIFPVVQFSSNRPVPGVPQSLSGAFLDYRIYAFEETADNPATPVKPDYTAIFVENALGIGITMVLVLVTIGLYNNRKMQMTMCWTSVVLMLICVGLVYYKINYVINPDRIVHAGEQIGAGAFSLSVALICTLFARRSIKKDEDLIRSADRIR